MARRAQLRLFFHGTIFILAAMLIGVPGIYLAVNRGWSDDYRQLLRQSHSILISSGLWLIATGAALPSLFLSDGWISALVWLLVLSGYTFMVAIVVLAVALKLGPPLLASASQLQKLHAAPHQLGWVYLMILGVSALASIVAGIAMIGGARKALRQVSLTEI
jgi:hypothetical protein